MVAFHMIDTATLGIRRAYNIQKAKYFKDLIVEYLRQYTSASKKDIRNLLWDKLRYIMDKCKNDVEKALYNKCAYVFMESKKCHSPWHNYKEVIFMDNRNHMGKNKEGVIFPVAPELTAFYWIS